MRDSRSSSRAAVEQEGSTSTRSSVLLPFAEYDPQALARHFGARPGLVLRRLVQVSSAAAAFALKVRRRCLPRRDSSCQPPWGSSNATGRDRCAPSQQEPAGEGGEVEEGGVPLKEQRSCFMVQLPLAEKPWFQGLWQGGKGSQGLWMFHAAG